MAGAYRSYGKPIKSKKHRVLEALYHRAGGRCTSCGVGVGLVHWLTVDGWILIQQIGRLWHPDTGEFVPIATVEHLVPLAKGGDWRRGNLTLYCYGCNQATAHFGSTS